MFVSVVDVIIVGIIGLFTIRCALRGFVSEFLSMAAVVFGLLFAVLFYKGMAPFVSERLMPEMQRFVGVISFVLLFLIVFVIVNVLKKLLKDIVGKIRLSGIDRFLGFFYGIAEGIIFICLLLFLISIQTFIEPELILGKSVFAEKLMELIPVDIKKVVESVAWLGQSLMRGMFTIV